MKTLTAAFSAFVLALPILAGPLEVADAKSLIQAVDAALAPLEARKKEKVRLPEKVTERVEALQSIKKQLETYVKTGTAPAGILQWFQDKVAPNAEDAKYLHDLTLLSAFYVEHLLTLYAAKLPEKDQKFLAEVQFSATLLGAKPSDDELKEFAAAIRMMDQFRAKARKHDGKKLSELGVLLRERCEAISGLTEEEIEKPGEPLSMNGKFIKTARCLENLGGMFEKLRGDEKPPLP